MTPTKFSIKPPRYNASIAFVHKDDTTRWILGWMDMYNVRVEGEGTYDINELTYWMEMPQTPSDTLI